MATYQGDTDKIVLESGERDISILAGQKHGGSLNLTGKADKPVSLLGEKNVATFYGLKNITALSGLKHITDLAGLKHIATLYGQADKFPILYGEAGEGYWKIRVDTTYIRVDSTIITVDRD